MIKEIFLAVIDDKCCCRKKIENLCRPIINIVVKPFKDPFEFLVALKQGVKFHLVICDRFGPGFDAVEENFPESCKELGYFGPIVLFTTAPPSFENKKSQFDRLVVKDMWEEKELKQYIDDFIFNFRKKTIQQFVNLV